MILTGKFFEYLAAKRPILCLGPVDGDAAQILSETRSGVVADFGDVEKMQSNILLMYEEFRKGKLTVTSQEIDKYSRKELTKKLASVLDSISHDSC
jgi:hypothetical protein